MRNLIEKRLTRLRTEGRLDRVRGVGVGPNGDRTHATVQAAVEMLAEKWGSPNAYAVANFRVLFSTIETAARPSNVAYLISHGGQWNEVFFVHATNDRIVPIRKITYDPTSGWTVHMGHPGGIMRAKVYESWVKIRPIWMGKNTG